MDEFRKAELTARVARGVGLRDLTGLKRAGEGDPTLAVVVCLGPGRCHIPGSQASAITCTFCARFPATASEKDIPKFVEQFTSGN